MRVIPETGEEEILCLEWYEDISNTVGCWYPDCRYERAYGADWQRQRKTTLSISAPVYCLYDQRGNNCITIALSEAVREVEWKIGVHEEDGRFLFRCKIHMGRGKKEVKLYINETKNFYSEILKSVQMWWGDRVKFCRQLFRNLRNYLFTQLGTRITKMLRKNSWRENVNWHRQWGLKVSLR